MNYRVPSFGEMEEEDCVIPCSSGFSRPKKPSAEEEEIMEELLWQNGQVVVQKSANNKSPFGGGGGGEAAAVREIRGSRAAEEAPPQHLFMHEDEMASWLHYPIDDSSFARDLCADDLFYSAPMTTAEIRPPDPPPRPSIPPPPQRQGLIPPRVQNFRHFSRLPRMAPPPAQDSRRAVHTASATPAVVMNTGLAALPSELTLTSSSPGASGGASFTAGAERSPPPEKVEPSAAAAAGDRKRKAREADYDECQSEEDVELDAAEAKEQACGSTSTRRSRAALVHNQSERRRRDRINEKMKALQELIPRSNKSDKASMLDEAIEYMKSLQMQLQMLMSMGCGMVPMMYPAMQQQQYMPMPAMMMGMGMNRPMMPYPSMLPIQNPAVAAMGPRFPMPGPGFHLPQHPLQHDNYGNQASPMLNPHDPNQPRMQNSADPYQQFFNFHHAQVPSSQNEAGVQPPTVEPNTSKEVPDPKSKQSGRK